MGEVDVDEEADYEERQRRRSSLPAAVGAAGDTLNNTASSFSPSVAETAYSQYPPGEGTSSPPSVLIQAKPAASIGISTSTTIKKASHHHQSTCCTRPAPQAYSPESTSGGPVVELGSGKDSFLFLSVFSSELGS